MAVNDYEHQHQVAFFQLVELQLQKKHPYLEKLLFAVPNGGQRSKAQAGKLKAEGVKSGVSDIVLLKAGRGYGYLCIEMKHGKNKQSESQKIFEDNVKKSGGGYYFLAYTSQSAMECLKWYIGE